MDMAVANLLKHKIRFERYGGDYGNVNYVSSKIENLESIGARSLYSMFKPTTILFYSRFFYDPTRVPARYK